MGEHKLRVRADAGCRFQVAGGSDNSVAINKVASFKMQVARQQSIVGGR